MKTKWGAACLLVFLLVGIPLIDVLFNKWGLKVGNQSLVLFLLLPVVTVVAIWAFMQIFYFIFLSLFGFKKAKRDYELQPDQTKFLIFIPAHNEEAVIAATLENLLKMTYDPAYYQIVVINDNSQDKTGEIARRYPVDVLDTTPDRYQNIGVGKPRALEYTYLTYQETGRLQEYDLIMVLDADNFVDENLLQELNSQYLEKDRPEAIQVYLDSKNYHNFLSLGYAASYWTMNRFFQLSKYRLGLPNSIGGTGFVVSVPWLLENKAFISTSLTEDLEMEIRIMETGGRVLWNHFARIYDEKPTSLKASMIQRFRWSKGHWYVAFTHTPRLIKRFLKNPSFRYIDQLSYLFSMRENFQIMLAIGIFMIWVLERLLRVNLNDNLFLELAKSYIIPVTILNYFVLLYGFVPVVAGFLLDSKARKTPWQVLKTVLALLWFSYTYMLAQIWGLLNCRNQGSWSKTEHKFKTTSLEQEASSEKGQDNR